MAEALELSLFPILDLPTELIKVVAEQVIVKRDLISLSQSCRRIFRITDAMIYRHLFARRGIRMQQILSSLNASERQYRAAAVQTLQLPCLKDGQFNFHILRDLLHQVVNLKVLEFESPACNSTSFEDIPIWRPMADLVFAAFQNAKLDSACLPSMKPLQSLRKVTLHMNGPLSPYWTMDASKTAIFNHPSIEELTLSCVNLTDSLEESMAQYNQFESPLRALFLQECNITHRGLRALLATPKALVELELGENCHNIYNFPNEIDPAFNHLFRANAAACIAALGQQKHSLTRLSYHTTSVYYQHRHLALLNPSPPCHGAFADFPKLKSVTLFGSSSNFELAVTSCRPPPALESLTCHIDEDLEICSIYLQPLLDSRSNRDIVQAPFLATSTVALPATLKSLTISFEYGDSDYRWPAGVRATLLNAANLCRSEHNISLKVATRSRGSFYPPFLYNEPLPKVSVIFNGETGSFFPAES